MQIISFNDRTFEVCETITSGQATVYKTRSGEVIKHFYKKKACPSVPFLRERFWLETLHETGITPKLIDVDPGQNMVLMEDVGEPISAETLPKDWREQINDIIDVLSGHNCRHNDLSDKEVLVKDGRLTVVDFGFASCDRDMTCGGRFPCKPKTRIFDDRYIVPLIDLLMGARKLGAEMHCFILWEPKERALVEPVLADRFTIVQAIEYHPKIFKELGRSRLEVLARLYQGRISHHGRKGESSFVVFLVLDMQPRYAKRVNVFNGDESVVNINTFDTRQELRRGRTSYIHGSDNVQEAYENLKTLTCFAHRVPLSYFEAWRPQFDSLQSFFATLNASERFSYLVLRNFDALPARSAGDIDLLVSDYYHFKRISGAISYKHKHRKRHPRSGPAVEYGGYKVAATVLIGGEEVKVDIRYVGDSYYDQGWERVMLERRAPHRGFYVPDASNHFYALLYHALVHKRRLSDSYRKQLTILATERGLITGPTLNDVDAWALLDGFMEKEGYAYVRPRELTLPFTAHDRAGLSVAGDLAHARTKLLERKHWEARDMARQVRMREPFNLLAASVFLRAQFKLLLNEDFLLPLRLTAFRVRSALRRPYRRV